MRKYLSGRGGFTLVELLVVTAIMGLVIGAVYSLYLTNMRTAYNQDEVAEVQQNLRIAMDAIATDLRKAGALVPKGTDPIDSCTATSLVINTAEPTGAVAMISKTKESSAFSNFSTTVDSSEALDLFEVDDAVRLINPYDGSEPFCKAKLPALSNYTTLVVESVEKDAKSIRLKRSEAMPFDAGVKIEKGYIITKKMGSGQPRFDKVAYSMAACPAGSGLGDNCLFRSVNGGSGDVIASNLSAILFAPLDKQSYGVDQTTAVQVTLTGVTVKKTSSTDTQRSRQLTSIIRLRNGGSL